MRQYVIRISLAIVATIVFTTEALSWSKVALHDNFEGTWKNHYAECLPYSDTNVWHLILDLSDMASGKYMFKVLGEDNQYFGINGNHSITPSSSGYVEFDTAKDDGNKDIGFNHDASKFSCYSITITWWDNNHWRLKVVGISINGNGETGTNEDGYYIYGSLYDRYNVTTTSKLHYKLQPYGDSGNQYYFDLISDTKNMAGIHDYSLNRDLNQEDVDNSASIYFIDMNSKFGLAWVHGGSISKYGGSGYELHDGDSGAETERNLAGNTLWSTINNGGMYRLIVTVDDNGTPVSWHYESQPNTIVAYKADAASNWTVDNFIYCTRTAPNATDYDYHGYNHRFSGVTQFTQNENFAFIIGNRWFTKGNTTATYTKNTSFGNNTQLTFEHATGGYVVMYDPLEDIYHLAGPDGEITSPITMWMAGSALNETSDGFSTWSTANSTELTFDPTGRCWTGTVTLDQGRDFRFLVNNDKAKNMGEDNTGGDTQLFNHVQYESSASSGTNIDFTLDSWSYTVCFYMEAGVGHDFTDQAIYWYTLKPIKAIDLRDYADVLYVKSDGTEEIRNVTGRGNYKYFCTWSDQVAWKQPSHIHVFALTGYTPATKNADNSVTPASVVLTELNLGYIPANVGLVLAVEDPGAHDIVLSRQKSKTSFNVLRAIVEKHSNPNATYSGSSPYFMTCQTPTELPKFEMKNGVEYANYLFGFYRSTKAGIANAADNDFALGFWISNGSGLTYAKSAYLSIPRTEAELMGVGYTYSMATSSAKPCFLINFDEEEQGVATRVENAVDNSSETWYTLQGVRVEKPGMPGIYLKGGKKIIVR